MKCFNPRKSKYKAIRYNADGIIVDSFYNVPCGECYYCLKRKRYQWYVRLRLENRYHPSYFVTLTYNDENLPKIDGVPVLDRRQLKSFFDSLRREIGSFSYLAVGEYGGCSNRPHYHFHIFTSIGLQFLYDSVKKLWPFGFIKFGSTTNKSINYCLKCHIQPKQFKNSYLVPPFTSVSSGIGKDFVYEFPFYDKPYFYIDGEQLWLPRYIREKLNLPSFSVWEIEPFELWNEYYEKNKGKLKNCWQSFNNLNKQLIENLIEKSKSYKL